MSSSSCVESSDEEEDNPYPITNPHYISDLKSTMPLVTISAAFKDDREVDTNTRTAAQIFLEDQLFKKALYYFVRTMKKLQPWIVVVNMSSPC